MSVHKDGGKRCVLVALVVIDGICTAAACPIRQTKVKREKTTFRGKLRKTEFDDAGNRHLRDEVKRESTALANRDARSRVGIVVHKQGISANAIHRRGHGEQRLGCGATVGDIR